MNTVRWWKVFARWETFLLFVLVLTFVAWDPGIPVFPDSV